jgi:hypothetical protein
MQVWFPKADIANNCAVLTLQNGSDWSVIHSLWGNPDSNVESIPARLARGGRSDFAYLGGELVCSDRALAALRPDIQSEVAPLRLDVDGELTCWILNVTNMRDCLDKQGTRFVYSPMNKNIVVDVEKYVFVEAAIGDSFLFRVPEIPARIFATERFRQATRDHYGGPSCQVLPAIW